MGVLSIVCALAAFSTSVHSLAIKKAPVQQQEERPDLDVKLRSLGNTEIEAVVTNPSDEDMSVLNLNTFFDEAPVQKVALYRADSPVTFQGVLPRYLMSNLSQDAFTLLPAGSSIKSAFDIAEVYDLSEGGEYVVSSQGTIPVGEPDGTDITSSRPYQSNKLTLDVNGTLAASVSRAVSRLDTRTTVQDDCQGAEGETLRKALELSSSLAAEAAEAALNNPEKFEQYFGTTDQQMREAVAERFRAVSEESKSTTGGNTRFFCKDPQGFCTSGTLAYTLPSYNIVSACPLYYSVVPLLADKCGGQDQATTALHEFTHAAGVVSPPTEDFAYGFTSVTSLGSQQSFQNADSYALFALDTHLGCTTSDRQGSTPSGNPSGGSSGGSPTQGTPPQNPPNTPTQGTTPPMGTPPVQGGGQGGSGGQGGGGQGDGGQGGGGQGGGGQGGVTIFQWEMIWQKIKEIMGNQSQNRGRH